MERMPVQAEEPGVTPVRTNDEERVPRDVETPEVVPVRVMKGMEIVREPVSVEVEREEPKREGMREKRPVSDEELDVVLRIEKMRRRVLVREDWAGEEPRRGVVRWRRAEVVERGDTEPMRVKAEERVLITVELADEVP